MFNLGELKGTGALSRRGARWFAQALLATTAISTILPQTAAAQMSAQTVSVKRSYNIPRQSLDSALAAFSRVAGVQVLNRGAVTQGVASQEVNGSFTSQEALSRLLAGTGLTPRFVGANTVTVMGPVATSGAAAVPGAFQLDTVDVSGGRVSAADAPYSTPAPVSHISQETIDRFRGLSPADIFRGTPGVMSGEARNGGGSIDVNVRGMQGMGRVAVTVDGAENNTTVYQGYQGISNRTFVDPDLLAGVDIQKGSDASSRGIAGTVAMRTLNASDVVKAGDKWGVWVKSGFGTNTATPVPGQLGGYFYKQDYGSTGGSPGTATPSPDGLNRPGALVPTSGSFSTVAAVKEDNYDLLWGYAFRKQGNYFAGKNGPSANPVLTGPRPYSGVPGWYYGNYMDNAGLTNYRAGEQVLNTQSETESWLAKATIRDVENGQSLQLGYTGFRSKAGDMIASIFTSPRSQPMQQAQQDITRVDTGTARYRWKPDDNNFVDLKANLWLSNFTLQTVDIKPEDFGLPYDYLPGHTSTMWGGDLSNTSRFMFDRFGSLDFEYGMSYLSEATRPIPFTDQLTNIQSRNGTRQEVAGFGKLAYKPVDWLTLKTGLRYSHDWSQDRSSPEFAGLVNPEPSREHGGYSPSAGVVIEPVKGTQFYANYSSALRMPTIFESVAAYSITVNPNLGPERSNNWEAGVNVTRDGVFASKDKAMLKFGYFNWDVKDYVARQWTQIDPINNPTAMGLKIYNIDRAKFEGLEFSGRYENNGFTADLTANYYLNVEFCPTAGTCANSTLSSDYATNQVPPEYSANLTLSQKLLDDDLTVGGRVSYIGPRSVGHGAVQYGAAAIIAPIDWKPYWLVDLLTEYKLTKDITLWATAENLLDQYYVDPLSLVQQPGPGRTIRLGMTGKFGGSEPISPISLASLFAPGDHFADWSGFHAGVNAAYNFAKFSGDSVTMDGSPNLYASEAPNLGVRASSFGIHAGYDYQFSNRVVAGIEADIAKSTISGSQITYALEGGTGADSTNLNRSRQFEAVQKSSIDWISTVRGRLGYAFNDRLMLYATGGAAFLRQNESRSQYAGIENGENFPIATQRDFTENTSLTRSGYVIGGGAEYKLGGGWSLKAEGLFASFDEKQINFPQARAGVTPDVTKTTYTPGYVTYDDPVCSGGSLYPGGICVMPGKFTTTTTPGTYPKTTGRKILSKLNIPMIKVGLSYRF
jgi:hemoglobin/transferrin/lactoferrin receptor protein